jgi:AcrR family transcriptional regulator
MTGYTRKTDKTRQRIIDALIECCDEKSFYKTTVLDICEKADIYKSTFYRYYANKDELIREMENDYVRKVLEVTKGLKEYDLAHATFEEERECFEELVAALQYHSEHRRLFLFLISYSGDPYFRKLMIRAYEDYIHKKLQDMGRCFFEDSDYIEFSCATTFVSLVTRWLKDGGTNPRRMAGVIWNMNRFFINYPPLKVMENIFEPDFDAPKSSLSVPSESDLQEG